MSSTNIEELSSKVVKDSTTPKQYILKYRHKSCSKVVKDSTTPKLNMEDNLYYLLFKSS